MATSSIEWTELTWNPTTGCDKISAGCKNCYAEVMTRRLQAMGVAKYSDGFAVRCHDDALDIPRGWRKPSVVFVNSMSDLFHDEVPISFIKKVFKVMNECPQHVFQVLTKRSARLEKLAGELKWTPNIWMGVSVENEAVTGRIDHLRKVPATVRFLSCEPLIGPLPNLNLAGIHWAIVGGESGIHSRPMAVEWVRQIQRQCQKADVAFFFKQWGGRNKKAAGRMLNGKTYDAMPSRHAIAISKPAERSTRVQVATD
ncbi:MAG: phage Gp37/Gp68 family protein [Nitrospira sp.]|nr:phage Gp37/Gp68 family protein [Nitrospira sp.]